jgi:hypothetical protein
MGDNGRTLIRAAALAACLLAVGCAGSKVLYLDPHPLPPREPASVRFLTEEPKQSYKVIALIEAGDEGWNITREKLEAKLVAEAAKLGGEAAILCAEKRDSPFVWTYVPLGMAGTANRTTLAAKVIVFAGP